MIGLGAAALAAAALEWGARAVRGAPAATPLPEDFAHLHLERLRPYFRRERVGPGRVRVVPARPRSKAAAFVDPKPDGTLRVFLVGGSVAARFDPVASRLAEFIERLLPGRRAEIIVCGMGAYDSARDAEVLRKVLEHEPDLVVLMSGNNELYGTDVAHPRLVALDRRLDGLWLYRALAAAVRPLARRAAAPDAPDEANRRFAERLLGMARRCRSRGVPLAICTLGANLADAPPARPPTMDPDYLRGVAALESGRWATAAASLRRFTARRPGDPFGRFYLAKCLDRLGDHGGAAAQYRAAADADLPGARTSPRRNRIIRAVASAEGAILVDLEREFESLAPRGLPGDELFLDECHWKHEYYPLVSAAVLRAVYRHDRRRSASVLAPAPAWRWDRLPGLEASLRRPSADPRAPGRDFSEGLLSALTTVAETPGDALSERAIHLLRRQLARDPARFAAAFGPREPADPGLREDPGFERCRDRLREAWPRVLRHAAEAARRARLESR